MAACMASAWAPHCCYTMARAPAPPRTTSCACNPPRRGRVGAICTACCRACHAAGHVGVEEPDGGEVVRLERAGLDDGEPLDLVVALSHHPRPHAFQRLHQPAVRVPPRSDVVGVRQVAMEEEHVIVCGRDVL
jgi:hypothetical protein